jgi:hypothetical protein
MKIKLWIKYDVGYLPTNGHRKLRYREVEEYINVNIKEISKEELIPAFNTGITIYFYNNKLWVKSTERDIHCENPDKPMTALEALIYSGVTYSTYFAKYNSYIIDRKKENREEIINRAEEDMNNYIVVDGELYKTTTEPMYCIYTFGLGNNHAGIGTSLDIVNFYNPNISKEKYFNALEYNRAVEKALNIAIKRGDTNSIDYIKNKTLIKVYNDSFVKRNPQIEHGDGDPFLNSLESITESSSSVSEAGILAMCLAASQMSK